VYCPCGADTPVRRLCFSLEKLPHHFAPFAKGWEHSSGLVFLAEHIVMTGLSDDIVMTRKPKKTRGFARVGRTLLSAAFEFLTTSSPPVILRARAFHRGPKDLARIASAHLRTAALTHPTTLSFRAIRSRVSGEDARRNLLFPNTKLSFRASAATRNLLLPIPCHPERSEGSMHLPVWVGHSCPPPLISLLHPHHLSS
jgi:hypothetical protein